MGHPGGIVPLSLVHEWARMEQGIDVCSDADAVTVCRGGERAELKGKTLNIPGS